MGDGTQTSSRWQHTNILRDFYRSLTCAAVGAGYAICRWLLLLSPGPEVSRAGSEGGQVDVKGGSRGILEPPRMGWERRGRAKIKISLLSLPTSHTGDGRDLQ